MTKMTASAFPATLKAAYQNWRETTYADRAEAFAKLADEGQKPDAMVISCCDSRVNTTHIFGQQEGYFFIHRNIANFVPTPQQTPDNHGTAAALEYAVKVLNVKRIMIVGHAQCGGVQACMDVCAGEGAEIVKNLGFVTRWIDLLKPAYERLGIVGNPPDRLTDMEQENVKHALENLAAYDFVAASIAAGNLEIHGLWYDFRLGIMKAYDSVKDSFNEI